MSEWRHELGEQTASRPEVQSTQSMLKRTHCEAGAILSRLRVDERESENKMAAQLARVEAHLGEETWKSALTSCLLYTSPSPRDRG